MVAYDNDDASIFNKGSFTNYVDNICAFFDHLPPCVDIFYAMNVDKKRTFLDHLPTSSCKGSLGTTPKYIYVKIVKMKECMYKFKCNNSV